MNKEKLAENLKRVREEVEIAAQKAGRKAEDITIVAVSKHQPTQYIKWARELGQIDFGENYIQEALEKIEELNSPDLRFHFIGRCQSNKAKYIPGKFIMVHSVDSVKFAKELDKRCQKTDISQKILIQINVAKEETKGGILIQEAETFITELLNNTKRLDITGLMCMPPYFENPEKVRPYFNKLRKLKEQLEQKLDIKLPHLSMGMSTDFKEAILEGATLVRIGTNIFGPRKY